MIVAGYVWDENQRPIADANVQEVGTGRSVRTNDNGYFSISVAGPDSELRFSHTGYDYDTVRAGDFQSYIELWPTSLDEVQIITRPKKDNTALYLALAAFAAAALYAMTRKTKKAHA